MKLEEKDKIDIIEYLKNFNQSLRDSMRALNCIELAGQENSQKHFNISKLMTQSQAIMKF